MRTISFTEFRNKASLLLSEVEKGEMLIVMKHGKPIAKIIPADATEVKNNPWNKPALRLVVKGGGLSSAILEERDK
ncbi:MAG: type II toxin-antitoxin system prevent-host-death family antitoxin [Ignavibacterium sp.]|nr:type II toxin-antitoxin system prevent-host-death family antitoxin [Ignavibacterium sp.]MCX7611338.1 type II toxin-antitoxin system prevent-host-death family antitoxin [Ignavibacterium sp.]MDW8374764.1 type II toxin-antitoxin system prevent-host-death family antitoxin [Ignavibacteriales bacterium]